MTFYRNFSIVLLFNFFINNCFSFNIKIFNEMLEQISCNYDNSENLDKNIDLESINKRFLDICSGIECMENKFNNSYELLNDFYEVIKKINNLNLLLLYFLKEKYSQYLDYDFLENYQIKDFIKKYFFEILKLSNFCDYYDEISPDLDKDQLEDLFFELKDKLNAYFDRSLMHIKFIWYDKQKLLKKCEKLNVKIKDNIINDYFDLIIKILSGKLSLLIKKAKQYENIDRYIIKELIEKFYILIVNVYRFNNLGLKELNNIINKLIKINDQIIKMKSGENKFACDLSGLGLTDLGFKYFLSKFTPEELLKIEYLNLSNNNLEGINLFDFTNLKRVDIRFNKKKYLKLSRMCTILQDP